MTSCKILTMLPLSKNRLQTFDVDDYSQDGDDDDDGNDYYYDDDDDVQAVTLIDRSCTRANPRPVPDQPKSPFPHRRPPVGFAPDSIRTSSTASRSRRSPARASTERRPRWTSGRRSAIRNDPPPLRSSESRTRRQRYASVRRYSAAVRWPGTSSSCPRFRGIRRRTAEGPGDPSRCPRTPSRSYRYRGTRRRSCPAQRWRRPGILPSEITEPIWGIGTGRWTSDPGTVSTTSSPVPGTGSWSR